MTTLVFQIVLKQWDKSQRNTQFQTAIQSSESAYPVHTQPQFMLFDTPCVLDQQALDFTIAPLEATSFEHISGQDAGRTIKQTLLTNGAAKLDRFIISQAEQTFYLSYEDEEGVIIDIGPLENGWIQAKYQWRYRIEKNNEIFWQYEEVTLNAGLFKTLIPEVFINHPPALTFNTEEI